MAEMVVDKLPVTRLDHVAIEVDDFDASVEFLCQSLGLTCERVGVLVGGANERIALLAAGDGSRVELVERAGSTPAPGDSAPGDSAPGDSAPGDSAPGDSARGSLAPGPVALGHLAFRTDDVDAQFTALVDLGCQPLQQPMRLEPARARTALLLTPTGLRIQLIDYDADSPDR